MLHTDPKTLPQNLQFYTPNENVRKTSADEIYCSVSDLISENGYHTYSLASVARWAGVSYQEIASRWPSKDALLSDTLDFVLDIPVDDQVGQSRLRQMSAEQLERACKFALLRWAKTNTSNRMRKLFTRLTLAMSEEPEFFEFLNEYTEQRSASFVSLFKQAMAKGVVRDDLDVSDLVSIGIGSIHYKICIRGDRPDRTFMNSVYDILFSAAPETPVAANQNAI